MYRRVIFPLFFFLFFFFKFYIALPVLWIESASLRPCLVGLLVGHVVGVSEDIKSDSSSRGLGSHASSFLDTKLQRSLKSDFGVHAVVER